MRIIKVKSLGPSAIFWIRAHPRKYFKMTDEHYSAEENAELVSLTDIWDDLVLVNPTQCDFCGADLYGFPPLVECRQCHLANEDRECFSQVKNVVAWWSGNPDPAI
jgi:hypothetical protein